MNGKDSVEMAIETLKRTGKLRVKAEEEFWILYKPCPLGSPALFCAASENGKRPSTKFRPFNKYRMFTPSDVYNWISRLEIVAQ